MVRKIYLGRIKVFFVLNILFFKFLVRKYLLVVVFILYFDFLILRRGISNEVCGLWDIFLEFLGEMERLFKVYFIRFLIYGSLKVYYVLRYFFFFN